MNGPSLGKVAIAMIAVLIFGPGAHAASQPATGAPEVKLGPAFTIFNSLGVNGDVLSDDGLLLHGRDDNNGKKKKKGQRPDHEESQGGGSGSSGGSSDPTNERTCWTWGRAELEFFDKINDARVRHGRSRLQLDPELSWVANRHSYDMRRLQRLYHTREDKLRERVTNWAILGENVGWGGSVDSLHRAFMESADHRQIVLYKEFNYVGVGVVHDEGVIWVTILFEAYDNPGTTMDMPVVC